MMWNNHDWKIQPRMLGLTLHRDGTYGGGDNNPINLNSMSLNQAIALMQKTFNFQGTIGPTVNKDSIPKLDVNTVDTIGSATAGEEDKMLQNVSQEFGKTDINGPRN